MPKFKYILRNILTTRVILYVVGAGIAAVMLVPFIWLMFSSLKTGTEILRIPPTLYPQNPTFRTYKEIFERWNFGRYFFNSGVVATCVTLLVLFTSSLNGYVFAKFKFRGKDVIFMLLLGTLMIPFIVIAIPLFLLINAFKWQDTYVALIIPLAMNVFGIFLMRQFIEEIPDSLVEVARIDGASEWWIYTRIILPLSKAALGALAIFQFMWAWNMLLWPLLVVGGSDMRTLSLALTIMQWEHQGIRFDVVVTGAAIAVIPVLVIFIIFQRHFVKGIAITGIKG